MSAPSNAVCIGVLCLMMKFFRAMAVIVLACLLCTVSPIKGDVVILIYVLRGAGIIGFITGLFFAQRLVRNMKSKK